MPRRQQRNRSSQPLSSHSDGSCSDSCFDEESEPQGSGSDTIATDVDSDVEIEDKAMPGITQEDDDHPPEYYRNLEEDPESDDEKEDYKEGSLSLIDGMEERFHRYSRYVGKVPHVAMREITPHTIKAFFAWLLNQRRGKGGRRVKGLGSEDSLGTYYKYLRLAFERETGGKMFDGKKGPDRKVRRMLRKLSKKHGLTREKREKGVIYVEDLAVIMQTNLTTTKKKYTHGRHRIQLALFLQLAGFSGNRPQAVLSLCYRHIIVTVLRHPNGGPHNILIEFTYEFTKQFLGTKEVNTFPVPEIIFDPSLALSPHVALLGLLLADNAFLAPGLTSAEGISQLDIRPGCNQLPLDLRRELADTPVFRKSYATPYGWEISPSEPLPYSTLLPWMETLGVITGLKQITRPYGLRYGAGNAFNQSKDVSDALQLMMLQHAKMETYIKHYLPRRVTADTRAIVSGMEPQHDLMRAACRMLRWIDPDRPQELTHEQSRSVNQHPAVLALVGQRAALKQAGVGPSDPEYKTLNGEIIGERRRQREALLKTLREEWDVENPVREIELQLSGFKFDQDVKTSLDLADDMPLTQRRLVETIITLPGTTLQEETRRRNDAINAVAAHCQFQEGGAVARGRPSAKLKSSTPVREVDPHVAAAEAEKKALDAAMLSVFKEERPTICFLCLGEGLIKSFGKPGDLSKHFKRKHLANIEEGVRLECKVCQMPLKNKMVLQNHAQRIHGTIS